MSIEPKIVLFAKKPVEGMVKTRLSPPLSAYQASQVAIILIEQSVRNACQHWPGKVELCLWPDLESEFIQNLADQFSFDLTVQSDGDLGDKMVAAMNNQRILNQVALIMGCDVFCSKDIYLNAFNSLKDNKNVIGPTMDGGYYCIGVQHPKIDMFEGGRWGSDIALQQTLISSKKREIQFDTTLPERRDLDSYDDLVVLSQQFLALQPFLI